MINRYEIKSRAKAVLRTCYIKAVCVSMLMLIATQGFMVSEGPGLLQAAGEPGTLSEGAAALLFRFISFVFIIGLLIRIFILMPLEVGCKRFFISAYDSRTPIGIILSPFSQAYLNQVLIMLLKWIYIFLWSLLLIVPGIIKSYSYRMVPYILAEDPGIQKKEAFRLSKGMMNGYKLQAFIFDLSFIGWYLANGITFGLCSMFFTNPYKDLADAGLYLKLKDSYHYRSLVIETGNYKEISG